MTTDQQLLSTFAQSHSQAAFRELLLRHQDWVYSVCLRRLPESGLAEDAAQAVFLALAQQAPKLAKKLRPGQLEPWLHQAAKYAAANLRRSQARRQRHEQEAAAMNPEAHHDPAAWQEIEPHLEPALDHLSPADRQAILLRFYRQLTHAQIATTLSITEEAAKKRVSRALDRLRHNLAKTNARASSLAVGPLLLSHVVHPVPVLVAARLASAGTIGAAASKITILSKGIQNMFHLAKLKFAAATVAVSAALFGIAAVPLALAQTHGAANPPAPVPPAVPADVERPLYVQKPSWLQATRAAESMPSPTDKAISATPIDALRAFNTAFSDRDAAAFLKLADAEDDEAKAIAAEMAKEFTAERDLKTLLLKKFNPADVQARVPRLYSGLLPSTILEHPPVEIQGDDAAIVLNTSTNYSIGLIKKAGVWKVKYLEVKMSQGPEPTKRFRDSINRETSLVDAIRKEVNDGTLTNLDAVESRLDAAMDPSSTQPAPALP